MGYGMIIILDLALVRKNAPYRYYQITSLNQAVQLYAHNISLSHTSAIFHQATLCLQIRRAVP
jgi:hypothetical protein